MINAETWLAEWLVRLKAEFGTRLLFMGLQGSYMRGEATEASDFDVMTVLDALEQADLRRYRRLLADMPEHGKACGFICGRQELWNWPKYELFQLEHSTRSYFGDLKALLPPVSHQHISDSIRIQAANIYHALCHSCIYGNVSADSLRAYYKSAFFTMQLTAYMRTGRYAATRRELAELLTGLEREIMEASIDWNAHGANSDADRLHAMLLDWCSGVLCAE